MTPRHFNRWRISGCSILSTLLLVCSTSLSTQAALLSFDVVDPDRTGPPDAVYLFTGSITNNTGIYLQSVDLFFDFSGFDPTVVTLEQLLGNPTFSIPDGTTSSVVDLFSLRLGPTALLGNTYSADALLQDEVGNLSDPVTVSVQVPVPEPSTVVLLFAGLPLTMLLRRHYRGIPKPENGTR